MQSAQLMEELPQEEELPGKKQNILILVIKHFIALPLSLSLSQTHTHTHTHSPLYLSLTLSPLPSPHPETKGTEGDAEGRMDVEEVPKKKRYKKFDLVVVTEAFGLSRDQLKAGSFVHLYVAYVRLSLFLDL